MHALRSLTHLLTHSLSNRATSVKPAQTGTRGAKNLLVRLVAPSQTLFVCLLAGIYHATFDAQLLELASHLTFAPRHV